ncbi:MAG TPA: L,D-transpeptidase [Nocardioidaceae bacterium]|nr:L,D-transpeptidase [Nocardioidaceae bacterium]
MAVGGGVGLLPTDTRPTAFAEEPPALALEGSTTLASGTIDPTSLASHTGSGRRVVFDQSAQRVWLVGASGTVLRTYLVSGSLTDNLRPGRYAVFSRSRWAVGVDDSGVMQYFVRFAHGAKAAIGFHTIPTKNGKRLQTRAQLGTPQSHGCIRQAMPDALAMWDFARVGTRVVVVA